MRGRALLMAALMTVLALPVAAQNAEPEPVVERVAGPDRYATAIALSQGRFPEAGLPEALVASGADFPDALGATAAAGGDAPVLLTPRDAVAPGLVEELQRLQVSLVTVAGGTAAVSEEVVAALRAQLGDEVTVDRVAGAERTATAAALSRRVAPDADTAVVTTGADFADAVAGGPLAASRSAPLLLVGRDEVPAPTVDALSERSLREVLVVGGTAVVGNGVLARLRELTGAEVRRVAGADRFATAATVSGQVSPSGAAEVVLATGRAFPDTLSAGAAAARGSGPLLLTEPDTLPGVVAEELRRLRPRRVTVVGGPAAVSDAVVQAVRDAVSRPEPGPPPPGGGPGSLELVVVREVERCEPGGECFTRPELVGTAADGSAERPLVERPPRSAHSEVVWRPDGGAFAYSQDFGVFVVPVDADQVGEPRLLRAVPSLYDSDGAQPCGPRSLEYSGDGARLLVVCDNGGELLLVDVEADRLLASAQPYADAVLAPDGTVVALKRNGDQPSSLVRLEPIGGDGTFAEREVNADPGRGRPVLGDLAVVETGTVVLSAAQGDVSDADLLVISLQDGSVRELARMSGPVVDLDVAVDGASVAVSLEPGSAAGAVIRVADGSAAFIPGTAPPNPMFTSGAVAWRPDGAALALVSYGDVLEVTPDAQIVRTLVRDTVLSAQLAWRPPR